MASAFAYFAQVRYGCDEEALKKRGEWFHWAAIATGLIALVLFVGG